jgi:acetyltransferase-like isoleucine patch superfamily enzyme
VLKKIVAAACFFLPQGATRVLYRLCGHRIGKNVRMPALSFVHADDMAIGNDVVIRRFVFISVHRLSLGANTIVSYGCQIKGDAGFSCKDDCFLGVHCLVHCLEDVSFGFYSGLGPRCTVYTHGSFLPVTRGYPARFAPVVMGDRVWVAMAVTIMPGAHIESDCIVNPGVVVQGRIKAHSLLQIDARSVSTLDLRRLRLIAKKDPAYWHHRIITEFLTSMDVTFDYDAAAASYAVPGRFAFVSRPEANMIELQIGRDRILYDLDMLIADKSRRPVHRRFLAFIRLHHGLTLRTRYR